MGDHGISRGHAQRFQHPLAHHGSEILSGDVLQHPPQQLVSGVGVVEKRTRFPGRLGFPQREALVPRRRCEIGAGRQPRGMTQHVPQGDRPEPRWNGEPGQVRAERRIQIQPARFDQLQHCQRGHGLADAANLEPAVQQHGTPRCQVGVTQPSGVESPVRVRDGDGNPRRWNGVDPAAQVIGKRLERGGVGHN